MYIAQIEDNKIINISESRCLSENILNIEVDSEIYDLYQSDVESVIYDNQTVIKNPDYDEILRERQKAEYRNQINEELARLDLKRIRAICENSVKDEGTGETWLEYYNNQIKLLRDELNQI